MDASRRRLARSLPCILVGAWLAGCASAPGEGGQADVGDPWAGLLRPRTEVLSGAPRVAVADVRLEGIWVWSGSVPHGVGLLELVASGLLRRPDIQFVERRRFVAAVERERTGTRLEGAPAAGVSPGAEWSVRLTLAPAGDQTLLSVRLSDPETGVAVEGWKVELPDDPDPVAVARVAVGTLAERLSLAGDKPAWTDPRSDAAPAEYRATSVPLDAVRAFLRGVAAEDRYQWDAARIAYQRAARLGGEAFFEPREALARVARIRAGGTLGEG